MSMRSRFRRIGPWLGLIALLLHALVPLAPAWAQDVTDSDTFPVVCTAHVAEVPADDGDSGVLDPSRCPLCLVQAAAVLPGMAQIPAAFAAPLLYAPPVAAPGVEKWAAARALPRGPPPAI